MLHSYGNKALLRVTLLLQASTIGNTEELFVQFP